MLSMIQNTFRTRLNPNQWESAGQNRQRLTEPHSEPCSHSGTVTERRAGPESPSAARYEISVKGLGSGSTLDSGPHSDGSGLQVQKLLQEESDQTFHNKIHADLILKGNVSLNQAYHFYCCCCCWRHSSHSWCVWVNEAVPCQLVAPFWSLMTFWHFIT